MKNKIITKEEASKLFKDGMTVMIGGFLAGGCSDTVIEACRMSGAKNLTVICNDGGKGDNFPDGPKGTGVLLANGQIKKLIATHIGLNPTVGNMMNEGTLEVELSPQGTMAERIRAGGAGLGGVLTPTGIGTWVENDGILTPHGVIDPVTRGEPKKKPVVEVDGVKYLLEKPLHADIAILHGGKVDEIGNVIYNKTMRNFNPLMAFAADIVIVGAKELYKRGELDPDAIVTPSVLVDYIVKEEK